VLIVTFILTRALSRAPAAYFAGDAADEASIAEGARAAWLGQSWPEQFFVYVGDLLQATSGSRLRRASPVAESLARRLSASLTLTLSALIPVCLVAIPLGISRGHPTRGPLPTTLP
jgi:peptide/nickel transport system permease protein